MEGRLEEWRSVLLEVEDELASLRQAPHELDPEIEYGGPAK